MKEDREGLEGAGGGWRGLEEAGGSWRKLEEAGGSWLLLGVGGDTWSESVEAMPRCCKSSITVEQAITCLVNVKVKGERKDEK